MAHLFDESGDLGLSPALTPPMPTPAPSKPPSRVATPTARARSPVITPHDLDDDTLRKLRRWVVGFALVEFDLELGPDLSSVYPPFEGADSLTEEVSANIAFSSLPEGSSTMEKKQGGYVYSWRIPRSMSKGKDAGSGNRDWHGFVYFYQEQSSHLRRGYSQRSLVLITHLPSYPGLFSTLISTLGPLHFRSQTPHSSPTMSTNASSFSHNSFQSPLSASEPSPRAEDGIAALEAAVRNIASWPDPTPGTSLELPFLGTARTFELPLRGRPQWYNPLSGGGGGGAGRRSASGSSSLKSSTSSILPSLPPMVPSSLPLLPLSSTFLSTHLSFSKIILLWELVLLGEPVVVFGGDVRTGSELVEGMRGFVRPIEFKGDWRPYFHIHDKDFKSVLGAVKIPPGLLLSFTNPLILSQRPWPHVLRATSDKPGLVSERKRHIKKDKYVEREVEERFARGDYMGCDAVIFRHLSTLTEQFLAPLNRYFGTLAGGDTSLGTPRTSTPFSPSAFLATLKSHGTPLPFRVTPSSTTSATAERFYEKFMKSPNFGSWLERRSEDTAGEVRKRYLERLGTANVEEWVKGRDDGEVDDLVKRMEEEARISDALADPSLVTNNGKAHFPLIAGGAGGGGQAYLGEELARISSSPEKMRSLQLRKQAMKLRIMVGTAAATPRFLTTEPFPAPARFGVIARGVDLNNLSEEQFKELELLIYTHKVVVLKDQAGLDPKKHQELGVRFDPKTPAEMGHMEQERGKKSILEAGSEIKPKIAGAHMVNLNGSGEFEAGYYGIDHPFKLKGLGHVGFHRDCLSQEEIDAGESRFQRWHIDAPFHKAWPARVTAIWANKMPSGEDVNVRWDDGTGRVMKGPVGRTAFFDCVEMYNQFTPEQKKWVDHSLIEYAPSPYQWLSGAKCKGNGLEMHTEGNETPLSDVPDNDPAGAQIIPMLWINPVTGEKAFQVHGIIAYKIHYREGPDEPYTLIEDLGTVRKMITDLQLPFVTPENVVFAPSETGDMLFFYNRGVRHTAVEFPASRGDRLLHQCQLIASDPPFKPEPIEGLPYYLSASA
ncbi:hypothetical protein MNV49_005363 [Pseudohyphozyma bogoriensis]|nr:hypothetical protein MNV49_005363 [Pseudohyphozyma bogoriensis]